MKYGIRECCDVVMRAKGIQKLGSKVFYKDEPVCYFDTLKTSSLEGAATTVYAQGGRGNPRLMSWDGERTLTFTMEDALISPVGLAILSGAGLIESSSIKQHITETVISTAGSESNVDILVSHAPVAGSIVYVMRRDSAGDIASEPYYYKADTSNGKKLVVADKNEDGETYVIRDNPIKAGETLIVDYYTEKSGLVVDIEAEKFGGSYYLEASTLWRDQDGVDYPAEFIIPNCRVQSNFTFTMAGSGDPSTFTFTLDAFPGYTKWNPTKKVLAEIQILGAGEDGTEYHARVETNSRDDVADDGSVTWTPAPELTGKRTGVSD